jgi:hypothetical protein
VHAEPDVSKEYLSTVWPVDRLLWKKGLLRALRVNSSGFNKNVKGYGYPGAALLAASAMWNLLAVPFGIAGAVILVASHQGTASRDCSYAMFVAAAAFLLTGVVHALQANTVRKHRVQDARPGD